jgi:glycosyltransferase involved in cell wall biosynthesis
MDIFARGRLDSCSQKSTIVFDVMNHKKILYIQYTNPAGYPPLEHSSRILANEGWDVVFLGTGAKGANSLTFPEHPKITVFQIPFCEAGWRQKLHYFRYCLWVLIWVVRWQPQWIYASDILVCPIAYFLALIPNTQVIYHEHDSPSPIANNVFMAWCLKTRKLLASRVKFCILPNQARIDKFITETKTSKPVFCVWNCPRFEEISPRRDDYEDSEIIWLLYHGSIVPARLPLSVIMVLERLPSRIKLRIIGYETVGTIGYINQIKTLATQIEVDQRLEIIDAMPRSELLKWAVKSDIGLALMPMGSDDTNLAAMTGASNKVFDYLASGLPLIVSNLPDWDRMYVETGYGVGCDPEDVNSIVNAIQYFLDNPDKIRAMGEMGRQKILDDWNYENQFEPILKILNQP